MAKDRGISLSLDPIGYVRSGRKLKFETPRQPEAPAHDEICVDLLPNRGFERALQDLAGFERVWLLAWFHQAEGWRPRVMPPRGPAVRRGLFATRSPHRPNPIALTCARLLEVRDLTLVLGDLDLVDGTPVLDIKPYLPYADAFPEARFGWVEEIQAEESLPPRFTVEVDPLASAQLEWLATHADLDLARRAFPILARDPSPNRTRRILRLSDGTFRIACGPWRLFFCVQDSLVRVQRVASGLSEATLVASTDSDAEIHRAFRSRWTGRD